MGQAESLSISGGDGHRYWVSITPKPVTRGQKKTIYKGRLLGRGMRHGEKVIAKSFTEIRGTKDTWGHEVTKADVTKQLVKKFISACPAAPRIRIVQPGIVEMDKVSKFENWREGRGGHRGLCKDEWISIEEYIPGEMSRYCPWTTEEARPCPDLEAFSHFTYWHSRETMVACDFQGVVRRGEGGKVLYIVTDSIIHSRSKLYGVFDQGDLGLTEFFKLHKCSDVCKNWPRPTPLTPPPSFNEACAQQLMTHTSPPPLFEDIVFPAYNDSDGDPNFHRGRPRYMSAREPRQRSRTEDTHDNLRQQRSSECCFERQRSLSNSDLSLASFLIQRKNSRSLLEADQPVVTPPPAYHSVIAPPLQRNHQTVVPGHGNLTSLTLTPPTPSPTPTPPPPTVNNVVDSRVRFHLYSQSSIVEENESSDVNAASVLVEEMPPLCIPQSTPTDKSRPHHVLTKSNSSEHSRLFQARADSRRRHISADDYGCVHPNSPHHPDNAQHPKSDQSHPRLRHVMSEGGSNPRLSDRGLRLCTTDPSLPIAPGTSEIEKGSLAENEHEPLKRTISPLMQRRLSNRLSSNINESVDGSQISERPNSPISDTTHRTIEPPNCVNTEVVDIERQSRVAAWCRDTEFGSLVVPSAPPLEQEEVRLNLGEKT